MGAPSIAATSSSRLGTLSNPDVWGPTLDVTIMINLKDASIYGSHCNSMLTGNVLVSDQQVPQIGSSKS